MLTTPNKGSCQEQRVGGLKWHRDIRFWPQPRGQCVREEIRLEERGVGERAEDEEEEEEEEEEQPSGP